MNSFLNFKKYHFVGIQGVGMTALALILADLEKTITGSDTNENFLTKKYLLERNIVINSSFDPKNIRGVECVIYGASHSGKDNCEVMEAIKRRIPVYSLAEFIGMLSDIKETIAVCGCHGKTTTSCFLAYFGRKEKLYSSYYTGSPGFLDYPSGKWDEFGEHFVVEADEYVADTKYDRQAKFLYLSPKYILATNFDYDHPDVYPDISSLEEAYLTFFSRLKNNGFLMICGDDQKLLELAVRSSRPMYTYGFNQKNDFRIEMVDAVEPDKQTFKLIYQEKVLGSFTISLLGKHNCLNVASGLSLYYLLGVVAPDKKWDLTEFRGVKRRIELVAKMGNFLLYDDYGHHPTEIIATLSALRKRYPDYRLVLLFQPHTFSRTKALEKEFLAAFKQADQTYLWPIFPSAREENISETVSSEKLAKSSPDKSVLSLKEDLDLFNALNKEKEQNRKTIFLTMGAGDVYQKIPLIRKNL